MSKYGEPPAEFLDRPAIRDFLNYHSFVESAARTTCPDCQFESNKYGESHADGCDLKETK